MIPHRGLSSAERYENDVARFPGVTESTYGQGIPGIDTKITEHMEETSNKLGLCPAHRGSLTYVLAFPPGSNKEMAKRGHCPNSRADAREDTAPSSSNHTCPLQSRGKQGPTPALGKIGRKSLPVLTQASLLRNASEAGCSSHCGPCKLRRMTSREQGAPLREGRGPGREETTDS